MREIDGAVGSAALRTVTRTATGSVSALRHDDVQLRSAPV